MSYKETNEETAMRRSAEQLAALILRHKDEVRMELCEYDLFVLCGCLQRVGFAIKEVVIDAPQDFAPSVGSRQSCLVAERACFATKNDGSVEHTATDWICRLLNLLAANARAAIGRKDLADIALSQIQSEEFWKHV